MTTRWLDRLTPTRCRLILLAVLLLGFFARVAYLTIDPPIGLSGDEAHYWDWSRQLDYSYYSKGPAVAYVIRFGCLLFGDTMFGIRFPALLFAAGICLCMYWLTLRVFKSDKLALGAVLLCHCVPMFVAGSMLMTIDPPFYFCWAMATCLGYLAVVENKKYAWPLIGVFVGLGFLAKYAALLWFVCLLVILLWQKDKRRLLLTPWPWLSVIVALAFTWPVVVWNMRNDWVTFGHVARSTTENQSQFNVLEILGNFASMVGSQIGILNPIIAGLMVCAVHSCLCLRKRVKATAISYRETLVQNNTPHPTPLPEGEWIKYAYLLAMSVPFFAIVAIVTIFKDIVPNWPAPTYFALIPLTAWFIAYAWPRTKGWLIAVIVMGILFTPFMHYATVLYPLIPITPRKWDPSFRLHGAQEIGHAVSDELKTLSPGALVLCDRYQTAGLMAFYVAGRPKTFCIGSYIKDPASRDRLSQYDMWPDRSLEQPNLVGRDAIYVGHEQPDLFVAFDRVERLPALPIVRNGVVIREQKLWRCFGFKGMKRPDDGLTKR